MASAINGTNIVLYAYDSNADYYFNGGTSQGTISGNQYYELSRTQIAGTATNFTASVDGSLGRFITDANDPAQNAIPAGTWTFKTYFSITSSFAGASIYYHLYKYDGSTFDLVATSSSTNLTSTSATLYTTTMTVPSTVLTSTDRFAIQVIVTGLSGRTITLYTQGNNPAYSITTFAVGTPFGAATNCSFESSTDQVEVTSQSSAWFREYKNDITTWSVTCDGFIAMSGYSYLALMQKQLNRESISVKFSIDNDNGNGSGTYGYSIFTGTANITSISLNGPVESASTYSVSLQGTGAYSITGTTVIDGGTTISTTSVEMFTYTAAGGETSITFSGALGLSCISVTRGGVEVRTINTSGTPTGEDVTFNSSTGVLTFATARALESDEFVRAIFK